MPTIRDRRNMDALKSAARGQERNDLTPTSRDYGFLVSLFRKFGDAPIAAGSLSSKIDDEYVLANFDVGATPANRNLDDRDVIGSRLPGLGWITLDYLQCKINITGLGLEIARRQISEHPEE